jgi:hypothetical protein
VEDLFTLESTPDCKLDVGMGDLRIGHGARKAGISIGAIRFYEKADVSRLRL